MSVIEMMLWVVPVFACGGSYYVIVLFLHETGYTACIFKSLFWFFKELLSNLISATSVTNDKMKKERTCINL